MLASIVEQALYRLGGRYGIALPSAKRGAFRPSAAPAIARDLPDAAPNHPRQASAHPQRPQAFWHLSRTFARPWPAWTSVSALGASGPCGFRAPARRAAPPSRRRVSSPHTGSGPHHHLSRRRAVFALWRSPASDDHKDSDANALSPRGRQKPRPRHPAGPASLHGQAAAGSRRWTAIPHCR